MEPAQGLRTVHGSEQRCIAATNWGARCRRDGDVRVDGGRVCRQHWTYGYLVYRLPEDVAVDPMVAARAAAVRAA